MFISDPDFFHPGSRVKKIPGSASTSKNLRILTPRIVSKLSEILSGMFIPDTDSGSGSIPDIRILILYPSWIPDLGGQKGTGSRIPDPQHCYGDR
jgi:hypothetical protein